MQSHERRIMKSAHLIPIFLGLLFFNQSLESQIDEFDSEENKNCCKFTENNGIVNCTQFCNIEVNQETIIKSPEEQKREAIEEAIKPQQTISVFSSLTTVCRGGFRLDSLGHCRKVLSPRAKTTTTTEANLNTEQ